jgi:hypothetical protein
LNPNPLLSAHSISFVNRGSCASFSDTFEFVGEPTSSRQMLDLPQIFGERRSSTVRNKVTIHRRNRPRSNPAPMQRTRPAAIGLSVTSILTKSDFFGLELSDLDMKPFSIA